jgi:hypothetical protein
MAADCFLLRTHCQLGFLAFYDVLALTFSTIRIIDELVSYRQ